MQLNKEVKIGIIVTLILISAFWGINFLKGKNLFTTSRQYYAIFTNIGGLQKSSTVSSNGFTIGQVSDVKFLDGNTNKILVEISINRKFKIPKNSIVEIYSSDFMGTKAANLIIGNSTVYAKNNDTLASRFEGDLNTLVSKNLMPIKDKTENLLVSIDSLVKGLNQTLNPETQRNIKISIAALEDIIVSEKTKIASILFSLESVSENLEDDNHAINNIIHNVSSITDSISKSDLKKVINETQNTIMQTNAILTKINSGKGSIGKFVNSDSLYDNLNKTLHDLDSLVTDLTNHPKRYVHFSVFGSKK